MLTDQWVITAAHCVEGRSANSFHVGVHRHLIWSGSDHEHSCAENINVIEKQCHPSYDDANVHHGDDICLLKLARAVTCLLQVNTVRLDNGTVWPTHSAAPFYDSKAKIAGWGSTDGSTDGSNLASTPQAVDVQLYTVAQCTSFYTAVPSAGWSSTLFSRTNGGMQCAGDRHTSSPVDSCTGDSGGPLFVDMLGANRQYILVGIVSWGTGNPVCGDVLYPGAYTRVAGYLSWIQSHVADAVVWTTDDLPPGPPRAPPPPPTSPPDAGCECSGPSNSCLSAGVVVAIGNDSRCGCDDHINDGNPFCYVVGGSAGCGSALSSAWLPGAAYRYCDVSPPPPFAPPPASPPLLPPSPSLPPPSPPPPSSAMCLLDAQQVSQRCSCRYVWAAGSQVPEPQVQLDCQ